MLGRARRLAGKSDDARALAALLLLFLGGTVVLALLGKLQHVPLVFRDELIYGGMAEAIANGNGDDFRAGGGVNSLFPYFLAPAWALTSTVPEGYDLAKVISATMYALTVIPLWLALRRPLGAWVALIPCVLLLAAPWSGDSSKLLTESLALPLVTSAVALLWWSMRSPEKIRAKLLTALGLLVLAAMIRIHLAALIPAFALAILIDALAKPSGERAIALRRLAPALVIAAIVAIAGLVIVFVPGTSVRLGIYETVKDFGVDQLALQRIYEYFVMMGIYGALLPPIALIALMITRAAWRDSDAGPLLAIVAAMALILFPVAGWFSAGVDTTIVERYAIYLIPWLVAMPFLGLRLLSATQVLIATLAVAVMVALPVTIRVFGVADGFVQSRSVFGDLFGALDERSGIAIVVLAVLLGLLYALCVEGRPGDVEDDDDEPKFAWMTSLNQSFGALRQSSDKVTTAAVAAAVGVLMLMITVPISSARWSNIDVITKAQIAPFNGNRDWVDDAVKPIRPVSMLALGEDLPSTTHVHTDFFNRAVDSSYLQNTEAGNRDIAPCLVNLLRDGQLVGHKCDDPSATILTVGDLYRISLRGGRTLAANSAIGTVITTTVRPPRLRSLVEVPCSVQTNRCKGRMTVRLWTEKPVTLVVTFKGEGEADNTVLFEDRFYDIPVSGERRIKSQLPAGAQELNYQLSWLTAQYNPTIASITLDGEEIYAIER